MSVPPRLGYAGAPSGADYEYWREEFCRRVMTGDVVPLAEGTGALRRDGRCRCPA